MLLTFVDQYFSYLSIDQSSVMNVNVPTTISVPSIRVSSLNQEAVQVEGNYVLYWMVAQRRLTWNFALQRAVEWSQKLSKPLIIFEPLRIAYPWANARLHHFIIEGMRDNFQKAKELGVSYYPYIEKKKDEGKGLLAAFCHQACVVVTDEYPCYFIPRMTSAAAQRASVLFEQVDSNGLLPLRASGRVFTTAASFRRHLQKTLLPYFATDQFPKMSPLAEYRQPSAVIPNEITKQPKWSPANPNEFLGDGLQSLDLDHSVVPCDEGGAVAAQKRLNKFLDARLHRYHYDRNALEGGAASGLSAHLHFGHLSVHEVAQKVFESCQWSPQNVAPKPSGSREGWWGASKAVEAFIDELVTWREIGFTFCFHRLADYDQFSSLPEWAQKTLMDHAHDERPYIYSLEQFESASTHDPLWNAAQTQLLREGRIHNYVRMLWGKKILEWTPSPQVALDYMTHLNNKYALDGRDPNSYSGIYWCLGRFDRAWGPERPIFGKIRFMSSDSTMRKLKAKGYVQKYSKLTEYPDLFA